ncbi:MAG: DUF4271 domain-containing protein [Bacteroidia bacterium]
MKILLNITQSIFSKHELAIKHNEVLQRNEAYHVPVFFLLFISSALAIYIYLRYYKKSIQVFSTILSYGASQQIQREGYSFSSSFSISFILIYVICGSIFFTDLSIYAGWFKNSSSGIITLLSAISICVIFITKKAVSNVVGLLIKEKSAMEDYFFQYNLTTKAGALVTLVVCLLLHYSNLPPTYLFPIEISIIGLLFVLRMIKTVAFGYLGYGFSIFHLVLYLCAFEIIPVAAFVKIIVRS